MSSTRLPGKMLAELAGEPVIARVVERARAARRVDEVVVLTSTDPSDDALVDVLRARAIPVRRGPLADVYARYLSLVEELEPDYLVRVTGDCPLIEPTFIDDQIDALAHFDADFIWSPTPNLNGTLGGQSAFSVRAFLSARDSTDPRDREHVASFYLKTHRHRYRWVELEIDSVYSRAELRLQVDEATDLVMMQRIFDHFADTDLATLPLPAVLRWLSENPEVGALNRAVEESADNQAYRKLSRDSEVSLVGRWP
jgi:spore coat polysaccharide biosynthesis protein SpsF